MSSFVIDDGGETRERVQLEEHCPCNMQIICAQDGRLRGLAMVHEVSMTDAECLNNNVVCSACSGMEGMRAKTVIQITGRALPGGLSCPDIP